MFLNKSVPLQCFSTWNSSVALGCFPLLSLGSEMDSELIQNAAVGFLPQNTGACGRWRDGHTWRQQWPQAGGACQGPVVSCPEQIWEKTPAQLLVVWRLLPQGQRLFAPHAAFSWACVNAGPFCWRKSNLLPVIFNGVEVFMVIVTF